MRQAFTKALVKASEKDKSIILLTGDLGFTVLEPFMEKFPKRFFNMGVSEQNMVGVAAGLALSGKKPFVYSIIPFAAMRPFEQIRNDICYQKANVKIVGVGAGLSYALDGPTHHSIIDIAIMRALPNMTVVCPADSIEAGLATKALAEFKGPAYLRLGKSRVPQAHKQNISFEIGKAIEVRKGEDAALIATGEMVSVACDAAESLAEKGIECRVLSMHTIKPLDREAVLKAAKETKLVLSIEEHSVIGGLGSAVTEVLAESDRCVLFERLGVQDRFAEKITDQNGLREENGLTAKQIAEKVLKRIGKQAHR